MFETRRDPLLPLPKFVMRLVRCTLLGLAFIAVALFFGTLGFHTFEDMGWVDAFANASLTLSDMGLISTVHTSAGKIFVAIFALMSGLIFLSVIGLIFAPVIHRIFHKFHLPVETDPKF